MTAAAHSSTTPLSIAPVNQCDSEQVQICRSAIVVLHPRSRLRRRAMSGILGDVIPTAILAGIVLGYVVRWWAIPIVALAWSLIVAAADTGAVLDAVGLGSANAAVGVLLAMVGRRTQKALSTSPR